MLISLLVLIISIHWLMFKLDQQIIKEVQELPYKKVVGNFMYVMMMTWFDIAYVVSIVA